LHSPGKQVGLLEDHAHLAHQRLALHVPDVKAVDQDSALGDIGEAMQQGGQGTLASAGRSYQGDRFSWFDVQVDVLEYLDAWDVMEETVIKGDLALDWWHLRRPRRVLDFGLNIEQLEYPSPRRHGTL